MSKPKADSRMWIRIVALALAGLLLLGVIFSATAVFAEEAPANDRYDLHLEVMPDAQTVQVTQTIDYTNRTGRALRSMMFSVYANCLRRQSTVPVEDALFSDAFPAGYAPGGVDFMRVQVNGKDAEWGMQGEGELFMRVECSLQPGETAQFGFEYYVLLPEYSGAMGVGDLGWRLTNFYPSPAVWDEYLEDFPLNDYTAVIEPMHSGAADFHVTMTLPETYHLAAPGQVNALPDGEGMVDYEINAEDIRELALIFSRKTFEREAAAASGAKVRVLANTTGAAQRILDAALPAMNWLEETFGAYPWPALTIIETDYIYEGAAYPGVIQISKGLTGPMQGGELEDEIVLLCMKQYFSGIVGSSRSRAPWLSEAVSSFVRLLYFEEKNGYNDFMKRLNAQVLPALNITIPGGVTVDSEAGRFTSRMEFELAVVDRGVAVLYEMRQAMGEEIFLDGLRAYVEAGWLDNTTASDFLAAMNTVSGSRWDEYLYGQMHTIDDYVGMGLEWFE